MMEGISKDITGKDYLVDLVKKVTKDIENYCSLVYIYDTVERYNLIVGVFNDVLVGIDLADNCVAKIKNDTEGDGIDNRYRIRVICYNLTTGENIASFEVDE